jgi:transposase
VELDSVGFMIHSGFLTSQERVELRTVLRRVRGEALALRRANMLLLLDKGWSFAAVAEALFLEASTVEGVYRGWKAQGMNSLAALDLPGRPVRLDEAQRAELRVHLENAHYATSQQIREHILARYSVAYSRAGIIAFLKKLGFVHAGTRLVAPVADEEKQAQMIAAYTVLKESLPENEVIVHMDGVHPTHMAKTGKVWVRKGKTLHVPANTGRGRVNIHGALNLATGQFTFMNNLTINAISTLQRLAKLEATYPNALKIHVFLDNARYHYSKDVQEWLNQPGRRIVLHFLPAYCPHLNPIERLWHILHNHVTRNRYYPTFNAFADAVLTFCRKTIPNEWNTIQTYVTDKMTPISNKNLRFI